MPTKVELIDRIAPLLSEAIDRASALGAPLEVPPPPAGAPSGAAGADRPLPSPTAPASRSKQRPRRHLLAEHDAEVTNRKAG